VKFIPTALEGLVVIEPARFSDERGEFFELYNSEKFEMQGLPAQFLQTNVSRSSKGVLRGLHFQQPNPQGKLVSALVGEVFDVAVDLRKHSPTFGRWHAEVLSEYNGRLMFIPEGFAHGFYVLSHSALFVYQCTTLYRREYDRSLAWNDAALGIPWPSQSPQLSTKDRDAPTLRELQL
jgi:dTDP-4-dehydrorhamnose 3,5-epimerase